MNFEFYKVCNWLLANRIALNVDKTDAVDRSCVPDAALRHL